MERIERLECETSEAREEGRALKKDVMKKNEKIKSLEAFISKQKEALSFALEAVTNPSDEDTGNRDALPANQHAPTPGRHTQRYPRPCLEDFSSFEFNTCLASFPFRDVKRTRDRSNASVAGDSIDLVENELAELEFAFKKATAMDSC